MEAAFNNTKMTLNPYQDPMGNESHQGLERFLQKFHQPGVPSHTIITDPEYYVFLWFHNAVGNLIQCPYTKGDGYKSKLGGVDFENVNKKFQDGEGIQSGVQNTTLPEKCLDLTPFVRDVQLPEIAPANGTKIRTLFGETTAGTFSPYASDGSRNITLQVLDTEYSILDAIFYPWMKDINSPWWYRPADIYTKWATPYPMATLEVQRPRMRYVSNPEAKESRNDAEYQYYSYRFLGVKPTNYSSFEANAGGRSNLLRSLTFICDMCLVDLTNDAHITTSESVNLGVRRNFIFSEMPNQESSDSPDDEEENDDDDNNKQDQEEIDEANEDLEDVNDDEDANEDDIEQQEDGDMPGEDEEEWEDDEEDEEDEDESEYSDDEGDNETQEVDVEIEVIKDHEQLF